MCTLFPYSNLISHTTVTVQHNNKTARKIRSEVRYQRYLERQHQRQEQIQRSQGQQHFTISPTRVRMYWNALPVDLLERIFSLLSIKERHVASQVCPHWFECFYAPYIWSKCKVDDTTLTKRKFNYYLGYQIMIDNFKAQV